MSLINDALKRASSDKPASTHQPAGGPPLQPVMTQPSAPNYLLPISLLLLGFAVLVVAAVLWLRAGGQVVQTAQDTGPQRPTRVAEAAAESQAGNAKAPAAPLQTFPAVPVQATPAVIESAAPAQAAQAAPASSPRGTAPLAAQLSQNAQPVPSKAQSTTRPAPEPARTLSLQAIYYRLRDPSVVINGKTVRVGDSVDGARVVSIQRSSVEVQRDGQYITLTLNH